MKLIVLVAFLLAAAFCQPAEAWHGGGGGWHHGGGGWGGGGGGWHRGGGGWGGGGWNRWGGHRHWRDTAALKKETTDESRTAPLCDWVEADAMLVCKTRTALFHCAVVANFTTNDATNKYDRFGIGMLPTLAYSTIEPLKYEYALYPRVTDDKWLDTKFMMAKDKDVPVAKWSSLSLFYSYDIARFGLRIVDDACFRSLTTMFSTVSSADSWRITVDKSEFTLFGEIRRV